MFKKLLTFGILTLISFLVLPFLHISFIPKELSKEIYVTCTTPVSSPKIVEEKIIAPLETILSSVQGLKEIESESFNNYGKIKLSFNKEVDLQRKKIEISTLIKRIYPSFPSNTKFPEISFFNEESTTTSLIICSVKSKVEETDLVEAIDNKIAPSLSSIRFIERMEINGIKENVLKVEYDNDLLLAQNLNRGQLLKSLEGYKKRKIGEIGAQVILSNSEQKTTRNLLNTPIQSSSDSLLQKLGDLADIYIENEKSQFIKRINGEEIITISLIVRDDVNELEASEKILDVINRLNFQNKDRFSIDVIFDKSKTIKNELSKVLYRGFFSLLILCMLIYVTYKDIRLTAILIISITVNTLLTLMLCVVLNINIHVYSIAGLSISFGLIIDNFIVFLDYYQKSKNLKVIFPILFSSLTTIATLISVFLVPEDSRVGISEFVFVIVINLSLSVLIAWIFLPVLFFYITPKYKHLRFQQLKRILSIRQVYEKLIRLIYQYRKIFLVCWCFLFGFPFFIIPEKIDGLQYYNKIASHDLVQNELLPFLNNYFGGTVYHFYNTIRYKNTFRPLTGKKINLNIQQRHGGTLKQMNSIVKTVEKDLKGHHYIKKITTTISSGRNAIIQIDFLKGKKGDNEANIVKELLEQKAFENPGVKWSIFGVGIPFYYGGDNIHRGLPFYLEMKGYDYYKLSLFAEALKEKLEKNQRISNINIDAGKRLELENLTEIQLVSKENFISNQNYFKTLNQLKSITPKSGYDLQLIIDGKLLKVYLEEKNAYDFNKYDLFNKTIWSSVDEGVKLSTITTEQTRTVESSIFKRNKNYIRTIVLFYQGNYNVGEDYLETCISEFNKEIETGFQVYKKKFNEEKEVSIFYLRSILIAIALIFFILSIAFESVIDSVIMMVIIPFSFIGIFINFILIDEHFDQGGYAALILLSGIIINSMIYILFDFQQNSYLKKPQITLLVKSVVRKITPIVITIFTSIASMLPFLLNKDGEVFWFSLATTTISGLLFSIITTLFLFPVLILSFKKKVD